MWELDQIGIKEPSNDNAEMEKFQSSFSFKDGQYETSLPWKVNHPVLQTNRLLARKRLESLLTSLKRKPDDLKLYVASSENNYNEDLLKRLMKLNK